MNQKKIIVILVSLILFLGLLASGYVLMKKYWPKSVDNLLNSSQNGLPGKLLGPITSSKAKTLDPVIVIKWTNQYRADNGLAALTENDLLVQAAQAKTDDMFQKQYFEHISPAGTSPSQMVAAAGYKYKVTGENLALGDFKNEKELVDAWMASPGHRENILNKDYTEIGIATGLNTYQDRGKTWLAVQEFGRPLANCTKPDTNLLADINNKKSEYENLKITSEADVAQAQTLQAEIQKESDTYNAEVNTYNICIKS